MIKKNVTIIDYGMGNILSIQNALNFLKIKNKVSSDANEIENSEILILPGVGSFNLAMKKINKLKIKESIKKFIKKKDSKILGICLGMHLLAKKGYENGEINGIGLIDGEVKPFKKNKKYKIPHVGFNSVKIDNYDGIYKNLKNYNNFYFTHSYRFEKKSNEKKFSYSFTNHGEEFIASFESEKVVGTQFHPEKSQKNGLTLLKNFLKPNA